MSKADARDVVAELFQNTKGNPYFIEQMIEGFHVGATDWEPLPLVEIIAAKLSRLPTGSDKLLEYVAIAGKATQAGELASASGMSSNILSLLTHMRSERLVRLVGSGEAQLVDTWHDKIRESILERMAPDARRATHLSYAAALESTEGLNASTVESYFSQPFTSKSTPDFSTARVYDIAYHYHLAGDRRALCFQFLAGELAFQTYASEEAIEYLERAHGLLRGDEPPRWQARLWHRLPLLLRSGSHFYASSAIHMKRHLYEVAGSASAEIDAARQLVGLASTSGDLQGLCWGHYDHAGSLARFGNIEDSILAIEQAHTAWEQRRLNLTTPIYLANRGFVFLQASQYDIARETTSRSWREAIRHVRVADLSLRGLAWYLECAAGPRWATNPAHFDRRLVRSRCRWARFWAMFHVKIRPHFLRSRGRAFTALGKARKGIRNFEWAVKSARQLGTKYDLAKCLLDLAAVKEERREENRTEAIRLLKEMESVIPRAESWLLGDQYDESVVAPEFDLEAWEREHGSVSAATEVSS